MSGLFGEIAKTAADVEAIYKNKTNETNTKLVGGEGSNAISIRTERIVNKQTSYSSTLSKAAFYDRVIDAVSNGADEQSAIVKATKSSMLDDDDEVDVRFAKGKTGIKHLSAHILDVQEGSNIKLFDVSAKDFRKKTAVTPNASMVPVLSIKIAENEVEKKEVSQTAIVADETMGKLKKLIQKMNAISASNNPFDNSAEFEDEPPEFRRIKRLYQKISLLVNDYDTILEGVQQSREQQLKESYQKNIENAIENLKTQLKNEYESKMRHDECEQRALTLSQEVALLKEENARLNDHAIKISGELNELRIFKSNAISEEKIMIGELAKRRIKQKLLRQRLKLALRELETAKTNFETAEVPKPDPPNSTSSKADLNAHRTTSRINSASSATSRNLTEPMSVKWDDRSNISDRSRSKPASLLKLVNQNRLKSSISPFGNHVNADFDDWASTTDGESDYIRSSRQLLKGKPQVNSETEGSELDDSDLDLEVTGDDLEKWWNTTKAERPKWNKSTTAKLFKDKIIPSVMYHPAEEESKAGDEFEAMSESADKDVVKSQLLRKIHDKCRKQKSELKEGIAHERAKRKKLSKALASRVRASQRLTDLLLESLAELESVSKRPSTLQEPYVLENRKIQDYISNKRTLLSDILATFEIKPITDDEKSDIASDYASTVRSQLADRTSRPSTASERKEHKSKDTDVTLDQFGRVFSPIRGEPAKQANAHPSSTLEHRSVASVADGSRTEKKKIGDFHDIKTWMRIIDQKRPHSADAKVSREIRKRPESAKTQSSK